MKTWNNLNIGDFVYIKMGEKDSVLFPERIINNDTNGFLIKDIKTRGKWDNEFAKLEPPHYGDKNGWLEVSCLIKKSM
jgi:hypothetical protein